MSTLKRIAFRVDPKIYPVYIEYCARAICLEGFVQQILMLNPEKLLSSQWCAGLAFAYSLLLLAKYLFALHQSVAVRTYSICPRRSTFKIGAARLRYVLFQKSHQARIHTRFHFFTEIGQSFHLTANIFLFKKRTIQFEIWKMVWTIFFSVSEH